MQPSAHGTASHKCRCQNLNDVLKHLIFIFYTHLIPMQMTVLKVTKQFNVHLFKLMTKHKLCENSFTS